jgi:uncharacterized protein (TIGR02145 family)
MKRLFTLCTLCVFNLAHAQVQMNVHLTDGTVYSIPVSEVDSITYSTGPLPSGPFNPDLTYGTVADIEGNTYATIVIGGQEWMAENLRTATYRNGESVQTVSDANEWSQLNLTEAGAWAYFDNGSTTVPEPIGKLYNWYAINDARGLCPIDWHVPSSAEWNTLIVELGGGAEAGGQLKSAGTQFWAFPNLGATNSSGFSGLPGGYRTAEGSFSAWGAQGFWWTAQFSSGQNAWYHNLFFDGGGVGNVSGSKRFGLSVRCVRD